MPPDFTCLTFYTHCTVTVVAYTRYAAVYVLGYYTYRSLGYPFGYGYRFTFYVFALVRWLPDVGLPAVVRCRTRTHTHALHTRTPPLLITRYPYGWFCRYYLRFYTGCYTVTVYFAYTAFTVITTRLLRFTVVYRCGWIAVYAHTFTCTTHLYATFTFTLPHYARLHTVQLVATFYLHVPVLTRSPPRFTLLRGYALPPTICYSYRLRYHGSHVAVRLLPLLVLRWFGYPRSHTVTVGSGWLSRLRSRTVTTFTLPFRTRLPQVVTFGYSCFGSHVTVATPVICYRAVRYGSATTTAHVCGWLRCAHYRTFTLRLVLTHTRYTLVRICGWFTTLRFGLVVRCHHVCTRTRLRFTPDTRGYLRLLHTDTFVPFGYAGYVWLIPFTVTLVTPFTGLRLHIRFDFAGCLCHLVHACIAIRLVTCSFAPSCGSRFTRLRLHGYATHTMRLRVPLFTATWLPHTRVAGCYTLPHHLPHTFTLPAVCSDVI